MELDRFLIGFEGLKLGRHDYRFLVDNSFFKELEYSEIQEGRVLVDAVFTKSERLMKMDLDFKGEVIIPCDLCGEDLSQEICFEQVSWSVRSGVDDIFSTWSVKSRFCCETRRRTIQR